MRLIKTSMCALLVGTLIMLAFPTVVAYPILENGHDSYDPPPYMPPTSPPPAAPPALPECGYFTVDCPSGGWMVDFYNAYDEYAAVHRNGPASWLYSGYANYSYLGRGWFPDSSQAYQWPAQVMPPTNATIMSVYMIVVARATGAEVVWTHLQFSIDGQENYWPIINRDVYPGTNRWFHVHHSTEYQEYLINITNRSAYGDPTGSNWTAVMLLSSQTYIRVYCEGATSSDPLLVDYVGLRYNWTFTGAPPAGPGWNWENSTLGKLTNASLLIGVLGVIGFVGMIVSPAVGIMMARHSEERGAVIGKAALAMLGCFALFWMAVH